MNVNDWIGLHRQLRVNDIAVYKLFFRQFYSAICWRVSGWMLLIKKLGFSRIQRRSENIPCAVLHSQKMMKRNFILKRGQLRWITFCEFKEKRDLKSCKIDH